MSTIIDRELVERCARAAYVAERPALGGDWEREGDAYKDLYRAWEDVLWEREQHANRLAAAKASAQIDRERCAASTSSKPSTPAPGSTATTLRTGPGMTAWPPTTVKDSCPTCGSGLRRTRTRPAHPWDEGSPSFTPFR